MTAVTASASASTSASASASARAITSSRDVQRYLPHLAAWRHAADLTQLDLAERAYVHRTTIAALESGRRSATLELVGRIADALGCASFEFIERPPADDELVVPTTCVQVVEGARSSVSEPPELLFYVPILWNPLERVISLATRTLDEAARAAERARIAADVGLTGIQLTAIAEGREPVSYAMLQRLAARLSCPMAALIDWRGFTGVYTHVVAE